MWRNSWTELSLLHDRCLHLCGFIQHLVVCYTFYCSLSSFYTESDTSHTENDVWLSSLKLGKVGGSSRFLPTLYNLYIYSERRQWNVSYTIKFPSSHFPANLFLLDRLSLSCVVSFWDSLEGVRDFQTVGGRARWRVIFIGRCRRNYFCRLVFFSLQGMSVSRLWCRGFSSINFNSHFPLFFTFLASFCILWTNSLSLSPLSKPSHSLSV